MEKTQEKAILKMDFFDSVRKEYVNIPVLIVRKDHERECLVCRIPGYAGLYDVRYIAYSMGYGPHYSAAPSRDNRSEEYASCTWQFYCPV